MLVKIITTSRFMPKDHNSSIHSCESVSMEWTVMEPDTQAHHPIASAEDWLRYEAFMEDVADLGRDYEPARPMDMEITLTRADGTQKFVYLTHYDGNAVVYIMDDSGKTIDKRKFDWNALASELAEAS